MRTEDYFMAAFGGRVGNDITIYPSVYKGHYQAINITQKIV